MRYFLKKSTPSKKGLYLQIYRTNYVPGKGNQNKSFKALGYVSDLKEKGIDDPIRYALEMIDELNKNHKLLLEKQIGQSSTLKNVGFFLPKAMFDLLNMDRHLNIVASSYKSHYVFSEFFRTLTYAQIVGPGSKQYLFDRIIPSLYSVKQYSYDQILDGLNFIGSDFHKYIEILNYHIAKNYKRNLNIGLFDCTNYYFEIDDEDEYRRKGPSKENRHDPILGQSLLLDGDMIPLDMELYPGNQSEKPYLRTRIEDMKNRNEVNGRIIQIADKGLNCARNIYSAVKEANDGYIFSKSLHGKNLSDIEKKWILLVDDDTNKWTEIRDEFAKHLESMDIEITEEKINNIYSMGDYFTLMGSKNTYESTTVILATGVNFGKPLKGEEEYLGKGVGYCATCDAPLYKDKIVTIIAYNKHEEAEANFLAQVASKVYYVPMYKEEVDVDESIEIIKDIPVEIVGEQFVKKLILKNNQIETHRNPFFCQ